MHKSPSFLLLIAALVAGLIFALVEVIPRNPEGQSGSPSVVTGTSQGEAQPLTGAAADARSRRERQVRNDSRPARGLGIEGITSSATP